MRTGCLMWVDDEGLLGNAELSNESHTSLQIASRTNQSRSSMCEVALARFLFPVYFFSHLS